MKPDMDTIKYLNYLCKSYDMLVKSMTATSNRIASLNSDAPLKYQDEYKAMEGIKGSFSRKITKYLKYWPIWTEWLEKVPGIGPFVAGNLILLYYYRFVAICPECGVKLEKKEIALSEENPQKKTNTLYCKKCNKSVKGDGVLIHDVEIKDFPMVSSWWHYMGRHTVDGIMPKRKKGTLNTWSTRGRVIGYHIREQFNRQGADHLYKNFMLKRKKKREQTHPDATKGHRHNMAMNETIKLFLSHFWHIARTIEGKSTEGPYAQTILKHTNIIPPYYWSHPEIETHETHASRPANETHG